jgi:hypothetical protein
MLTNPFAPLGNLNTELASRLDQAQQAPGAKADPPARPDGAAGSRSTPDARPLPNISLHFKIDSQTNQVTVLILDKATREVIRTIPPEELKELRQGELLELFG